jgi:N-acetylglucosamine-6-sulfatase
LRGRLTSRLCAGAALLAAGTFALALVVGGCGEEDERTDAPTIEADRGPDQRGEGGGGTERSGPFVRPEAERKRPNIIVLMTDDLGMTGWNRALPRTRELLGAGGTEFGEAIVSTPLCCPSRVAFLSGRYGHNTGVLENDPGYPAIRDKDELLAPRLERAGYRTAMVGKFMNGWDRTEAAERGEAAPGWQEWVEMVRTFGYYDYELNVNGSREPYGGGEDDYLTDVLTEHALEVIDRAAEDPEPLFMWMSWWAPHPELSEATEGPCQGSAIPRSRDEGPFGEERLQQIDSVDEADVRDKPAFIRNRRDLRPHDRQGARQSLRCRLNSLPPVDEGVEAIVERLRELGELDDTVLIFTSDNGFLHLEHRFPKGKGLPYEEAIKVPLVIDLPDGWGRQLRRSDVQVSNIDLAPTILELAGACGQAGARSCRRLDGHSLLPLLSPGTPRPLAERSLLVEAAGGQPCGYSTVRTPGYMYAEYDAVAGEHRCPPGQRELYNLRTDPHQLDNLLHRSTPDPPAGAERALRRELRRLQRCEGSACRRPRG